MQPKLKENPWEWRKFTWVVVALLGLLAAGAYRRHWLGRTGGASVLAVLVLVALVAGVWPQGFRGFYRRGMTVSFHVGQFLGRLMLVLFFLVVVTPLGWMLRWTGKDLLRLRRDTNATTYWHPVRNSRHFDRLF
jgi:hypothetical protein